MSSFLMIGALVSRRGHEISLVEAIAVFTAFWAADVLIYAVCVSLFRGSIGNLITGRRVVRSADGSPLTLRKAIRRYFARRNYRYWMLESQVRDGKARKRMSGDFSPRVVALEVPASYADRCAGSMVVHSRDLYAPPIEPSSTVALDSPTFTFRHDGEVANQQPQAAERLEHHRMAHRLSRPADRNEKRSAR